MAATDTAKSIVAAIVFAVSLLVLYLSLHGLGPRIDAAPHVALGEVLAREALKLCGQGGRIFAIARDTSAQKNPYSDAQWRSFQRSLKKSGASIAGTTFFRLNPIRLVTVPPGDFLTVIRKASEKDVIVSFLGPPVLSDDQVSKLPDQRPKILAVCSGGTPRQVDLRRIFEQDLLTAAVLSRSDASRSAVKGEGAFLQNFALVTKANMAELPLFASSSPVK